ncbi:MAG: UDP-3-O-(3-hydroxymyristoyl)glucosamine N-acyltransferase [Lentisphaeria bacterium]|nr:UDP-3-O-(3-hydroxymyristoyl)glucosamine N-acyltransferase [Lentisphaeria bacterium]
MNKIYKVSELAEMIGATINGNPDHEISGVNSLKLANANEITFLSNVKYRSQLEKSKAAVILVAEDWKFPPQEGQTLLYCKNIDKSFSKLCKLFAPEPQKFEPGIHPSAVVHPTAQIAEGVYIGPTAVVEANAVIGKNTVIGACVYVGENVEIGENCMIYPNVSIMRMCKLGNKIIIHGGATIGGDGFGFNATFTGLVKVPQDGIVQIDNDVEIGANSTIDRARFGKTWIKKGVKIDNLVHVAHNVIVGESSVLIGQCGIAGSAEIGRGVIVAAQAGVNGHITLGDGSKVAGCSAVQRSLAPGASAFGTPAESEEDFIERHMLPRKVRKLTARLEKLEAELAALKGEKAE